MSSEPNPRIISPPSELTQLGPLVVVEGECAYFREDLRSLTAFSLPGELSGADYQAAMDLGMRRSGAVVYRPLCKGCRRCQPLRVSVEDFAHTRSQKRVWKRCQGLFEITIGRPVFDDAHLDLYARYQTEQHGEHPQSADEQSYRRFLIETVTDTIEMSWRDESGKLIGIGILDVTPQALSSVYFYWEPALKNLSLGTYSALVELNLCAQWGKPFYYLGYLVAGSKTMTYKASFPGAEVWSGTAWTSLQGRDVFAEPTSSVLKTAERQAMEADANHFSLESAKTLNVPSNLEEEEGFEPDPELDAFLASESEWGDEPI